MAMAGTLIAMTGIGVATAVAEEILVSLQKTNLAKWVKVGGVTGTALVGVSIISSLGKRALDIFS